VTSEFTARRFVLEKLTEWVSGVVPRKEALPIHGCIRVTVAPDGLQFVATDTERTVFASSPSVSTSSEGVVYLPAQRLKAILAEAPDGDITIRVKADYAEVAATGGATWSLKLPVSTEYAKLPDVESAGFAPVSREKLLSALRTVRYAAGRDSSQPAFAQVHLAESAGAVYATASSGGRYSRAPVPGFPFETSIPTAALDDLIKLLSVSSMDDVQVAELDDPATGLTLVFRAGPVTLAVLGFTQKFPDQDRLVLAPAQGNKDQLGADRGELQTALRRVRINADATTSAVGLVLADGSLTLEARDETGNRAQETIKVTWAGGDRLLVINAQFLLDMLAVHPGKSCVFRVGKDEGKRRAALLLEDAASGVTGVIPQMQPSLVGR